jgi:hypothetical protein
MSEQEGKDLYLVAWVDFDQDDIVENAEYDNTQLHF